MKKRSFAPIIIMLLILLVSVGYSILATNLNINGTSKIAATSWDIHFENVVPTSNSNVTPNVAPSAPAENKVVSLTYDVNLINPGDVYEFEVDVVNAGRIDAVIEMFTSTIKVGDGPEQLVSTENIPSYLDYSVQYKDGSAIQTNGVIDAGDSKKIVVHVGLKSSVTQEELSALEGTTIALNLGMSYKQK